jgi:hypothetical protein
MTLEPRKLLSELYADAFVRFGSSCLWSKQPVHAPTPEHARIIAHSLKVEGGADAYALARRIEEACDAVDRSAA